MGGGGGAGGPRLQDAEAAQFQTAFLGQTFDHGIQRRLDDLFGHDLVNITAWMKWAQGDAAETPGHPGRGHVAARLQRQQFCQRRADPCRRKKAQGRKANCFTQNQEKYIHNSRLHKGNGSDNTRCPQNWEIYYGCPGKTPKSSKPLMIRGKTVCTSSRPMLTSTTSNRISRQDSGCSASSLSCDISSSTGKNGLPL